MTLIKYCKALSDDTRARLVNVLMAVELNVGEIVQVLEMGQSRISRHLKILSDSGLVECRREGLWAFYRAVESGPARDFLDGVAHLLQEEPACAKDCQHADKVVRERTVATRRFFDSIAPDWERLSQDVLGSLQLSKEIRARLPKCSCAADLGCGPGDLLDVLAEKARAVIGVDNSPKMLELAQERFLGNNKISLRIGELNHLPLADWEADCAVLSLVLHHLPMPVDAIREAARVLKIGGKLLVVEFDSHDNELMRTEYGDRLLGVSPEHMFDWFKKARFKVGAATEFSVNMGLKIVLYEAVKQ